MRDGSPGVADPPGGQGLIRRVSARKLSPLLWFPVDPQTVKVSAGKAWKKMGKVKQGLRLSLIYLFLVFKTIG